MKISVFTIWRNSSKYLDEALQRYDKLASSFDFDFSFYFYENDSDDTTPDILKQWIENKNGAFLSEKLNVPHFGSSMDPRRMALLCYCRNKCKSLCADDNLGDYVLLIDGDVKFSPENLKRHLSLLQSNEDVVMSTPNILQNIPDLTFGTSDKSYYDVYPLRDFYGNNGLYFSSCPFSNIEDRKKWNNGDFVECQSAFGGFVLLKTSAFSKSKWSSSTGCDHVHFCHEVGRYGKIVVDPKNIVETDVEPHRMDERSFAKTAAEQYRGMQSYDKLWAASTSSEWKPENLEM